ncbi:MAG: hypothetical protein A2667_00780 [Candidatus Wildermuthbacteria bacterium RIFCSPHIGHO2_01_FULL_47_27]|nr:MAG: UDP-glucose 6-dehydrogenase [Parcubacteria group bacterium GW2011_GWA2_47_9]OHA64560.1 MAG: hypothetical protein A2667_00780 [Candidatus Wildermuthbacteria bacterium RIFCSPHIGHO2_01_FULL_47_27]
MPEKPKLSFIGLGKLGSPAATVFASRGFPVVALDINEKYVRAVNDGIAPVVEPKLQEYLNKARGNIRATQNYGELIAESDITFLIIPTPSLPDGHFSDAYLKDALKDLAAELRQSRKPFHIFVIVSTVSPGTVEKSLIPWIERHSARKFNEGFGVAYNPEFIALGDVINGLLRPDMVLIGEGSKEVGELLEDIYGSVCENKPNIARMSIVSAEIAKISLNVYVTTKISFANTLANVCEQVPGADVDAITRALGADKRISPYYLSGGLSFGGPCFPRDGRAFVAFAKNCGIDAKIAKATDEINQRQIPNLVKTALKYLPEHKKAAAVFGLAYKPSTPVIEESPAVALVDELLKNGVMVTVYDPLAMDNAKALWSDKVFYASSVKAALEAAPLCIFTTKESEFMALSADDIVHEPTTIIDCWRMFDPAKLGKKVKYVAVGRYQ